MNKKLFSAALIATLGALAFVPAAGAATNTGTIQINGKVLQDTCTVTVNGSGNTVTLTPVMASSLASSGAVAGATPFTLNLSNCDKNATQAQLSFTSGANNATDGNLTNTGSAGNVEVQLLAGGTSGSAINVKSNANAPAVALSSGTGSTNLAAQYYATGAGATPGLVSTSASVTFTYQ
jgi:major type 1 subunit fimbrin (pilin)